MQNVLLKSTLILVVSLIFVSCTTYDNAEKRIDKKVSESLVVGDYSPCLDLPEEVSKKNPSVCEKGGGYCTKMPRVSCVFEYAEKSGDINACYFIDEGSGRDQDWCFRKVAEKNSDSSVCEKLDEQERTVCRAVAEQSPDECLKLREYDTYNHSPADACLREIVARTFDPDVCLLIDNSIPYGLRDAAEFPPINECLQLVLDRGEKNAIEHKEICDLMVEPKNPNNEHALWEDKKKNCYESLDGGSQ